MRVHYFDSSQYGAPTLNATMGSLIALLDACLVNGFGTLEVVSLRISENTATVETSQPHLFKDGQYLSIQGANEAELNGDFPVRVLGANLFSYPVYGATTAEGTGTITVKRPGANWEKVFSGLNEAVYRSKEGIRPFLHVIDNASTGAGTREASWRGYRDMESLTAGFTEPFPTPARRPTGIMVYKTGSANALPQPWILIADSRAFYLMCQVDSANNNTRLPTGASWPMWHAFGELAHPFMEVDPYCCFIAGNANANAIGDRHQDNGVFYPSSRKNSGESGSSAWLMRGIAGTPGAPVQYANMGHCWDENAIGEAACFAYPHRTDNGMMITPIRAVSEGALRGYMPGFYESMHGDITGSVPFGSIIDGEFIGMEGRKFIVVTGRRYTSVGAAFFDITGPWR